MQMVLYVVLDEFNEIVMMNQVIVVLMVMEIELAERVVMQHMVTVLEQESLKVLDIVSVVDVVVSLKDMNVSQTEWRCLGQMHDCPVGSDGGHLLDLELQVVIGRVEQFGHLEEIEPVTIVLSKARGLVITDGFFLF